VLRNIEPFTKLIAGSLGAGKPPAGKGIL